MLQIIRWFKGPKRVYWIFLLFLFLLSAFTFQFPPTSGLTDPVPIGKFLNGQLPVTTPAGVDALSWSVTPAFANLTFNDPLAIAMHPRENRMFVASRQGVIHHFVNDPNVASKTLFADLSDRTAVVWDGGFLGLAFHPEFGLPGSPNRNYLYAFYCAKGANGQTGPDGFDGFACPQSEVFYGTYLRLSRFSVFNGALTLDPSSELKMINIRLFEESHRGGGLTFGNDGFLYLSIGDQSRYLTAQNIVDNFEGGVIRIDVNQNSAVSHAPRRKMGVHTGFSDEFTGVGYFIPNDNPWLSASNAVFEEFWEIGHRAPHRMTLDKITGDLWIGEVGHGSREEVTIVRGGANAGWPVYEGNLYHNNPDCGANSTEIGLGTYNPPVVDFFRSEANALIGGYVYRGARYPSLQGKYICGDHLQNRIFAVTPGETGPAAKDELTSFVPGLLATFGQDHEGEIYMGGLGADVHLYTLQGSGGEPAPQLLSETGAFADLQTLEPSPGVIPYDMIEPFWSDGAAKYRWLAIPNDGSHDTAAEQIQFSADGNWGFPRGAVLIKHFELGGKRLETRLEVKGDDDRYYYLTYKWNSAGTDAELLDAGLDETVLVDGVPQVWHYPGRAECQSCHQQASGNVLGLKTRYLNKSITYPISGIFANQLVSLSSIALLDVDITEANSGDFLTVAAKNDPDRSLADRARSYLDVNCSYCHQPGTGNRAGFDMRYTTPLDQQSLVYGALLDHLGITSARAIFPRDTARSMVHIRLGQSGTDLAMPPLAKNKVDAAGVQLIADWINSLPDTGDPCAGSTTVYLSDLEWIGVPPNGWGPAERDRSNGETGDADGHTITINGRSYPKGLGAHAYSEILYDLDGQYSRFLTDIGVDDETCEAGSVQFEVYTDQTLAYQSPVLTQADDALSVSVNVSDVQQLKLVMLDGGNGIGCDHGDWADARLVTCESGEPLAEDGNGLRGTYFDNHDFTGQTFQRIDPVIDFNWGTGAPAAYMGIHTFSVRWEGSVEAPVSGNFTFYTTTDDGVRLYVDHQLILDRWIDQPPTENAGTIALIQGREYDIRMEYYESFGGAVARLGWSGPGVNKQIIPSKYLYPAPLPACTDPVVAVAQQDPTCGQNNGKITFSFSDHISQSSIEFSLDGGATYAYVAPDNSGTRSVHSLAPGTYDLWARWGAGSCPVNLPDLTLVNENTGCPIVCNAIVSSNHFEDAWGLWLDPGSDATRSIYPGYANSGRYCIRLRDNDPNSSFITSKNLHLEVYESLRVEFSFVTAGFDSPEEDFWLQISTDGGNVYQTIEEWNLGDEFLNDFRQAATVVIPGPFTPNTRIRFRCDASANDDQVYLDDIRILGCTVSGQKEIRVSPELALGCESGGGEPFSAPEVTRLAPGLAAEVWENEVRLNWTIRDPGPFIGSISIQRAVGPDAFFETIAEISSLESDRQTTGFIDRNPLPDQAFYRVKLTGADGISGISLPVEALIRPVLSVYPNPVGMDRMLTIDLKWPSRTGNLQVRLYNLQGRLIRQKQVQTEGFGQVTQLSTQGLAPGAYLLRVEGDGLQHMERVIVQ